MKPFLALSLLAFSLSSFATVKIKEELYIPGQDPVVVKDLINTGSVIVDHVSSKGFELYGSEGLSEYLDSKKIAYLDMKDMKEKLLADYPTSAQTIANLKAIAARYPNIMQIVTIGKSVKGQELLFVKISDNVRVDEVEPEFKYISSMHGDEITGRELTMMLVKEIGEKYGKDREITELVNNTEIYIMPTMNPDGSDLKQRGNARNVDLNRNFPDMTRDRESNPQGRELETQAIMAFEAQRQFALSANFHGGAVVANYPWDSKYDLHPLDGFVKELSLIYAETNAPMRNSREFPNGITNGAAWYVVKGGMQDWSYVWFNDLQITVELSDIKWPSYSDIPSFYKDNRDSMVNFMKEVHRGAGFRINRPNVQGVVEIQQTSPVSKSMGAFTFYGSEYYKVMPEGEYTFTVKEKNKAAKVLNVRIEKDVIRSNYQILN